MVVSPISVSPSYGACNGRHHSIVVSLWCHHCSTIVLGLPGYRTLPGSVQHNGAIIAYLCNKCVENCDGAHVGCDPLCDIRGDCPCVEITYCTNVQYRWYHRCRATLHRWYHRCVTLCVINGDPEPGLGRTRTWPTPCTINGLTRHKSLHLLYIFKIHTLIQ